MISPLGASASSTHSLTRFSAARFTFLARLAISWRGKEWRAPLAKYRGNRQYEVAQKPGRAFPQHHAENEARRTFHVRRVTASLHDSMLSVTGEMKSGGVDECGVAMSAMSQQQSLAQTWKRRQRRQRILVAVVIAALLAALAYGWLHVFGMF